MLSARVALGSRVSAVSNGSASRASAKASWCPGAAPGGKLDPAYLNGTIPGDFGESATRFGRERDRLLSVQLG